MSNFKKEWKSNDIYNFNIELNRIENYNKYVENWLNTYYGFSTNLTHNVNWTVNDIVDVNDINRIKSNINILLEQLNESDRLPINTQVNQVWTSKQANEIEETMRIYIEVLGNLQFNNNITGLTITGNDLRMNMGE